MIEVTNLTKRYAGNTAIEGLTFSVGQGEIVGFLGPNGAGKTTTMRILSCYMPATSGTARVAGFDVFTQADEVRRRIGYMPENNPLHTDMRVREYLKFRARLKGLPSKQSRRGVDRVIQQCGLAEVRSPQRKAEKAGRKARRSTNELSFHSLRHTATSRLKNAGVSDVGARDSSGHESGAVSRNYTHIDQSTKRKAIDKMPDIIGGEDGG
jgi:ABC-2 type transport system ATP-binding protein